MRILTPSASTAVRSGRPVAPSTVSSAQGLFRHGREPRFRRPAREVVEQLTGCRTARMLEYLQGAKYPSPLRRKHGQVQLLQEPLGPVAHLERGPAAKHSLQGRPRQFLPACQLLSRLLANGEPLAVEFAEQLRNPLLTFRCQTRYRPQSLLQSRQSLVP